MPPNCRTVRLALLSLATFAIVSAARHFSSSLYPWRSLTMVCKPEEDKVTLPCQLSPEVLRQIMRGPANDWTILAQGIMGRMYNTWWRGRKRKELRACKYVSRIWISASKVDRKCWLTEIGQLSQQGATRELEEQFKFQKRSCKLSFLFLPHHQSASESLLAGYSNLVCSFLHSLTGAVTEHASLT